MVTYYESWTEEELRNAIWQVKKRINRSPDWGDAVVLAFAPAVGIFDPVSTGLLRGAQKLSPPGFHPGCNFVFWG